MIVIERSINDKEQCGCTKRHRASERYGGVMEGSGSKQVLGSRANVTVHAISFEQLHHFYQPSRPLQCLHHKSQLTIALQIS
jgi:hypothetical protein